MNYLNYFNYLDKILAVAEKELTLQFRFKLVPIIESFVHPATKIIPLLLVYYGFLHFSSAESFGEITKDNYIIFLGLGVFLFTIFAAGTASFASKFRTEKFWKTIDAIFVAPLSTIQFIIGVGISDFVIDLPAVVLSLTVAFIIKPIGIIELSLIFLTACLVYLICLSAGLLHGSMVLSKEGYNFVLTYFFMGWSFFSCFFYPITIIPNNFLGALDLQTIVYLNPVYQGLNFVNNMWLYGQFSAFSFFYVLALAIIMPVISGFVFRQSWKKLGIEGY